MSGEIIGHYRIEERLGAGAWSVVYRAHDIRLERPIALKVVSESPQADECGWGRVLNEGRLAAGLSHPNICAIYEVGEDEGRAYIAMEYIEGLRLNDLIPDDGFPPERAVSYGLQIADALAHAHAHGIIHGDIKSSNVLITEEGNVKLLDFGLARRFRPEDLEKATSSKLSLAEIGPIAGTLTYMAPELLRGKPASPQSDIWALGVLLHEMARGQLPFKGSTAFELAAVIMTGQREPLPPEHPSGLCAIIQRCLEKDLTRRYQSAREVLDGLAALATAPVAGAEKRPSRRGRRLVLVSALTVPVLFGLLLAIPSTRTLILRRDHPTVPPPVSAHPEAIHPGSQTVTSGFAKPRNPDVRVWVNTRSRTYHCPGTRWYGKTKEGVYMMQRQARARGYTPSGGKPCEQAD